jgi:hypothetical protein
VFKAQTVKQNSYERTAEALFSVRVLGILFNTYRFINVFEVVLGDFSLFDMNNVNVSTHCIDCRVQ